MRKVGRKLTMFGSQVKASDSEILFMADAIVKSFNDINGQCMYLDNQIKQLTEQRLSLQPQLDAARSLAEKIEESFPAPMLVQGELK